MPFSFQQSWETKYNVNPVWSSIFKALRNPFIPLKYRDVTLRILNRGIQVGSRLASFADAVPSCPRCGLYEDISHCFFSCHLIGHIPSVLARFLETFHGCEPPPPLFTFLFFYPPDAISLPWLLLRDISFYSIWIHRCSSIDPLHTSTPAQTILKKIFSEFQEQVQALFYSSQRDASRASTFVTLRRMFTEKVPLFQLILQGGKLIPVLRTTSFSDSELQGAQFMKSLQLNINLFVPTQGPCEDHQGYF